MDTGQEVTKVKGLKNKISFYELESLLNKNSAIEIGQEKWFKNIKKGSISIKDQIYTLSTTENKRQPIYENGILVATKPFVLNEDEEEDVSNTSTPTENEESGTVIEEEEGVANESIK